MKTDSKSGRYISTFDIESARKMHYDDKLSLAQIAAKLGLTKGAISFAFKKAGIQVLTRSAPKITLSVEQIIDLLKNGESYEGIAKSQNVSAQAIKKKLKNFDLNTVKNNDLFKANLSKKQSETTKKLWESQEYRNKVSHTKNSEEYKEKTEVIYSSDEYRKKMSDSIKHLWQNRAYKEKQDQVRSTVEFQQEQSNRSKLLWTKPGMVNHMKSTMLNVCNTEEYKNKLSVAMKDVWTRDEYRKKITEIFSSPEYRSIASHRSTLKWEDASYRERMGEIRANTPRSLTKPHNKVCDILDNLSIEYKIEHLVGPYVFDIFIPSKNMLIEVQGNYWHALPKAIRNDKSKATYMERYFPDLVVKYIWEHECLQENKVLEKLKYWLNMDTQLTDYQFHNLVVEKSNSVQTINEFLYTWHYQSHGRNGIDYVAKLGDQIIAVARFISPTRQEIATTLGHQYKEVLELSRLCVHPRYQKRNLLSWFLSRCEKDIISSQPHIKCLVSFADSTFNHTGAVYKASNWILHSTVQPDYFYIDADGWVMHKKTLWNHSKKMQMTEVDYANKYGFIKTWGKEKYKFIKEL